MAQFHYRGIDHAGDPVDGAIEGDSVHQVTRKLTERGMTVTRVEAVRPDQRPFRESRRLSWDDLNTLMNQLESLTRVDLPVSSALRGLAKDLKNPRLQSVFKQLQQDLNRGESLEGALERQQDRIPPLFAHVVRAGVASGNVHAVLLELCNHTDRMVRMKNAFKAASYYPMVVFLFAVAILGVLLYGVGPAMREIYDDAGATLPWLTRFMLDGAEGLFRQPVIAVAVLGAGIAAFYFGLRVATRSERGRWWLDTIRMGMPIIGKVQRSFSLMRFCKTFGLLLYARVPIVESLELAGAASGSTVVMNVVDSAVLEVAAGEPIGEALNRSGFFGNYFHWLVGNSESRGDLPDVFKRLGEHYEREVIYHERMLGVLMMPVLLIIVGAVVVTVLLSIYLPLLSMGQGLFPFFDGGGIINS